MDHLKIDRKLLKLGNRGQFHFLKSTGEIRLYLKSDRKFSKSTGDVAPPDPSKAPSSEPNRNGGLDDGDNTQFEGGNSHSVTINFLSLISNRRIPWEYMPYIKM